MRLVILLEEGSPESLLRDTCSVKFRESVNIHTEVAKIAEEQNYQVIWSAAGQNGNYG